MENIKKLTLSVLPEKLGICHLGKRAAFPEWTENTDFCSLTRTDNELSIVCPQNKIPAGIMAEKNWRAFRVEGPLGFVMTGIVSSLAKPLADKGISIFYISTYETDYLLVEDKNLQAAKEILGKFCNIK